MEKRTLLEQAKHTPPVRRGPRSWFDSLPEKDREQVLELRRAHHRGELPHTKSQLFKIAREGLGLTITEHAWMYWWDGDGATSIQRP